MTQRTCTKNNGCFIKRREENDEYGDVTRLDLSNMRPAVKSLGTPFRGDVLTILLKELVVMMEKKLE